MAATIAPTALTLTDWATRLAPDSKFAVIAEMLKQRNEILEDMLWKEGNLITGERATIRTGLPDVFWRMLNQHTPTSKSTTAQIDFQCGMLSAWSKVDVDLANLGGNSGKVRLEEAKSFLESMNQKMASNIFYGNAGIDPAAFTGLSSIYSSLSAKNAQNIINAGGSGTDNFSVWLIGWGDNTVYGIFPKGSKAGLQHTDHGKQIDVDPTGGQLTVYKDEWKWHAGMVVKDWRYAVRIANIDVSDLTANSTAAVDLRAAMIMATKRLPSLTDCKPVFYVNRTVAEYLDIQTLKNVTTGAGITYENVQGKPVTRFRGIPVRIVDQLVTETVAVA